MPFKPVDQAIKIILGPCIDDSDFKSREEALTYDQAGMEIDVILEKHDGTVTTTAVTPTESGAGVYDWAHTDQGYYELELPASGGGDYNNDTEGSLTVVGYCTGVLPFKSVTYDIVPEKVWNSLVEGSDNLEVDAIAISASATAANNVESVFTGAGDTGDVDLVARSLKLNNDADVALEILSSDDSAIKAVSSASGKHGMELAGNVAGNGLIATGGSTGAGLKAVGGSSSGAGIYANASANNDAGMELVKHGTGKDIDADQVDDILTDTAVIGALGAGLTAIPWNSAWDAEVESEVADALNAAIPGTPTANSINERIKTIDDHDLVTKIPGVITAAGPTKAEMDTAHGLLATPAQVATALTNYDAPTKAEMDTAHALLATPAQVATALTNYDAPTKAEMDAGHALLATPAQVNAQVLDVLNVDTFGESSSVPAATSSLVDKIKWLCTLARNKIIQTATTTTVYADNGTTSIATSTVSDDGTTFTRGELA